MVERLLQGGLLVGALLMATGLAWAVATGPVARPIPLGSLFREGTAPDRLMALGVLALALTPISRVVALVLMWRAEGDYRFVATGMTVVVVLAIAVLLGHA